MFTGRIGHSRQPCSNVLQIIEKRKARCSILRHDSLFQITKLNRAYDVRLTGDGESVLTIPCAIAKMAGIFTCVAENSEGEERVDIQLVVHSMQFLLSLRVTHETVIKAKL